MNLTTKAILSTTLFVALSIPAIGNDFPDPEKLKENRESQQSQQSGEMMECEKCEHQCQRKHGAESGQGAQQSEESDTESASNQGMLEIEQQSQMQYEREPKNLSEFHKSSALNLIDHVNQREIELANLALEKSRSPEIKNAAQKIKMDHQQANEQLQTLARKEDVKLSGYQPAAYEKNTIEGLKNLEGSEFDQAFRRVLHDEHRVARQELELAKNDVKDPQIREYIDRLLPKVRGHEQVSSRLSG